MPSVAVAGKQVGEGGSNVKWFEKGSDKSIIKKAGLEQREKEEGGIPSRLLDVILGSGGIKPLIIKERMERGGLSGGHSE